MDVCFSIKKKKTLLWTVSPLLSDLFGRLDLETDLWRLGVGFRKAEDDRNALRFYWRVAVLKRPSVAGLVLCGICTCACAAHLSRWTQIASTSACLMVNGAFCLGVFEQTFYFILLKLMRNKEMFSHYTVSFLQFHQMFTKMLFCLCCFSLHGFRQRDLSGIFYFYFIDLMHFLDLCRVKQGTWY